MVRVRALPTRAVVAQGAAPGPGVDPPERPAQFKPKVQCALLHAPCCTRPAAPRRALQEGEAYDPRSLIAGVVDEQTGRW